jgi:hypothetical protein
VASGLGLVFWVALGILVTTWYERKRLFRMPPDLMEYVDRAVLAYRNGTQEPPVNAVLEPDSVSAAAEEDAPSQPPPA